MDHPSTTLDLHREHWQYVRRLLPRYGVFGSQQDDVAQTVWETVHRRIDSYDPATHKSRRAWITGIVQRCAANHRRGQRRREGGIVDLASELLPAPGLDPEQAKILRDLVDRLPNKDQREALLLQVIEGLSLEEIATIQGVPVKTVEGRLRLAKEQLKGDERDKAGAFLGFGSLEALAEALRPGPIPDEVGEREWERIAEAIRQQEGAPADDGPSSSFPPSATPPFLPRATAAAVTIGKAKLAGVLVAVFLAGGGAGIGAMLTWQAHRAARQHELPSTVAPSLPPSASSAPSSSAAPPSVPFSSATPRLAPSSSTAPLVAPSSSSSVHAAASAVVPSDSADDEAESRRLLARISRAVEQREYAAALEQAQQHQQRFGTRHRAHRDALREQAVAALAGMDEHAAP